MDNSNAHFDGDRLASENQEHELVDPEEACPGCGEDRIDWLAWSDDGEYVTCDSCGTVYLP